MKVNCPDLILLFTQDDLVLAGCDLIKYGLKDRYPRIKLHLVSLPFDDISTDDENMRFMSIAAKVIKEERDVHHCKRILLNIAGGRKNMCITLALLGQILNVDGVFHIVNNEIKLFNQHLERCRPVMMRLYRSSSEEEKEKIYLENRDMFNRVLFPARTEYEIVRIPTLPYPISYISSIVNRVIFDPDMLSKDDCNQLVQHGIIEREGNNLYISDYGARLLDVLVGK